MYTISPQKHDHTFGTKASQHGYIDPEMDNMILEAAQMQNNKNQPFSFKLLATTSKHFGPRKQF